MDDDRSSGRLRRPRTAAAKAEIPPRARGDSPRPTLKTLSQATGLAIATVSRALHDAPDIGEATKRRVHAMAAALGYQPNRAGVRLRTGQTQVISLVLSTDHDQMNHTARLISSLALTLRSTPYHLNVTPYAPGEDPMEPVRLIVESGSADAVILNRIEPEDPRVRWLMERNFPFATHGRTVWSEEHPWFDWDNDRFGRIAARELARRGRRRIALVPPPLEQNYAQLILGGVAAELGPEGTGFIVLPGATSDDSQARMEAAMAELLARDPEIDGVIAASTNACMAVVAAAEDAGREIGADIDVFAKEAMPFLQRFRRSVLAVHEDVSTAGAFLARAAIQRITEPDKPPMQGLEVPRF